MNGPADTPAAAIDILRRRCYELGLSFTLSWNQVEDLWYARASRPGEGEFTTVERIANEYMAAARLLERINEKWPPG